MLKNFNKIVFFFFLLTLYPQTLSAQNHRPNFNRIRTFDVEHYIIRLNFNREEKHLFGETTVRLRPLRENFKEFELDAAKMNFDSVKNEENGKSLNYRVSGDKIFITLDKTYSPTDLIAIRLKYSTAPEKGVYFVDELRENGKVSHSAQIWTQNEPEDGRYWFPSYDFPDDKATSEQFITVLADETAIGNGDLLEIVKNADGTKTFHYKMAVRHSTYLTSFIVGRYAKISDFYKNVPLGFFVYPGRESLAKSAFGKTKDMMRIFEELTGVNFPFNKYDQTIVANYDNFSAMENITATTLSDRDVFIGEYGFGKDLIDDLVSHELAHSWFGNLVTCRNWAELWLNEGFATFMEAAFREKMHGRANYLRKIQDDVREYKISDVVRAKRHGLYNQLARPDDSIFDATTYQKGGAVIHTLRETVGDQAFWSGVKKYLERHKFENVETPDLQKVMEEASGQNLDWFFAQWIYAGGYPVLEVEPIYEKQSRILTVNIKQIQEFDKIVPEVFVLPLEIEISDKANKKIETVRIDKRIQSFAFRLNGEPQNVLLDLNLKIPLKTVKYREVKIVN